MLRLKFRPDDSTTEWWQRGLRRAKATLERANLPTVAEHVAKLQWRRARATVVPLIDKDTAKPKLVAVVGEWCAIAELRKHRTVVPHHGPYFYPSRGRKRRWEEKFQSFIDEQDFGGICRDCLLKVPTPGCQQCRSGTCTSWRVIAFNEELWNELEPKFVEYRNRTVRPSDGTRLTTNDKEYIATKDVTANIKDAPPLFVEESETDDDMQEEIRRSAWRKENGLPKALSRKRVREQTREEVRQSLPMGVDTKLTSALQPFHAAAGKELTELMKLSDRQAELAFGPDPDRKPETWRYAMIDEPQTTKRRKS